MRVCAAAGLRHPVFWNTSRALLEIAFRPQSSSSSPSVLPSGSRAPRPHAWRARPRPLGRVRREAELGSSARPGRGDRTRPRRRAALPGADAALLVLDGRPSRSDSRTRRVERAAHETPPKHKPALDGVVYRYRLDEVERVESAAGGARRAAADGRRHDRLRLSAVTRANPPVFPPEPPTRSKRSGSGRPALRSAGASPRRRSSPSSTPSRARQSARLPECRREGRALAPLRPPPRPDRARLDDFKRINDRVGHLARHRPRRGGGEHPRCVRSTGHRLRVGATSSP